AAAGVPAAVAAAGSVTPEESAGAGVLGDAERGDPARRDVARGEGGAAVAPAVAAAAGVPAAVAAAGSVTPEESGGAGALGGGSLATAAAGGCRTSPACNTGPSRMRLATTAIVATDIAVPRQEKVWSLATPRRGRRCAQERIAVTIKTKVPSRLFVVTFNM